MMFKPVSYEFLMYPRAAFSLQQQFGQGIQGVIVNRLVELINAGYTFNNSGDNLVMINESKGFIQETLIGRLSFQQHMVP